MKKIILFLLLTAVFYPKINFGCTCLGPETFCESIKGPNGDVAEGIIILRGEYLGQTPTGLGINVHEFIYGESINQAKIDFRINLCTVFIGDFEEGKEYLFAIRKNDDNFFALDCRIFYLNIENEVVKGKIAPGVNSIAYEKLAELEACGSAFNFLDLEKNILLFPNPTIGEINIKNTSSTRNLQDLEIKIFDIIGRQHQGYKSAEGILPEEVWSINLQNLAAGVYIIKLSERHREKTYKIVKQ